MIPCPHVHGWDIRRATRRGLRGNALQRREPLVVPALNQSEATELPFSRIEVTVMIGVACDEPGAADPVDRINPVNHLHRERQAGDPRVAGPLVLEGNWLPGIYEHKPSVTGIRTGTRPRFERAIAS